MSTPTLSETDPRAAVETSAAGTPHPQGAADHPWVFIPLLYFMEGVPYVIITTLSVLMYNKMGIPNDQIGLWTSLIAFPWTLKMLWGPVVDMTLTKRKWILGTQALLLLGLAASVWAVGLPNFLAVTLAIFGVMAFLSATHDIAADGFYLLALDKQRQAFFVGVRSTFYRLATIFGTGMLVWLAGRFIAVTPDRAPRDGFSRFLQGIDTGAEGLVRNEIARAWMLALAFGALVYGVFFILNTVVLPRPAADGPRKPEPGERVPWAKALATFFQQRRILWILAFILFYRFGESMIGKMSGPFLQHPVSKGGLAVPTDQIGIISGTIGVLALTLGGILGGFVIARYGIKRCLWPMVLSLNIPNLFYVWAAFAKPGIAAVTGLVAVDQFGYGFGFSAYMVYLMFVSQGSKYETSHYAVATGLMALGAMGAGILSGFLQVHLGYAWFFVTVCLLTIPGMITLFFIPLDKEDIYRAPVDLD
jgi:MFS transporter, PAT family, beta-lactamase induction signal transducer AmpG